MLMARGRVGRIVHLRRGEKKPAYVMTVVDRATRCITSWAVVWQRSDFSKLNPGSGGLKLPVRRAMLAR
jgi:hypothetical protein